MVRIGAHLHEGDPLEQALALGADVVQFFLGDPQGWKAPVFPGEPAEIRASFADAGVDAYIHAPYLVNVASPNNRIRIPSRKILAQQLEAAIRLGMATDPGRRPPTPGELIERLRAGWAEAMPAGVITF